MAEWARSVATTISDYARGVEDKLVANRVMLAMMKKEGLIEYNCAGTDFKWQSQYRQAPIKINNGEGTVSPSRQDRFKQPSLTYVGFQADDAMTKREKLMNRGTPALVNYFQNMAEYLMDDVTQRMSQELYVDSAAAGNTGRLSGLDTMFEYTQTVKIDSNSITARTANAADVVAYPNATYAGLSTTPGSIGSWDAGTGIGSVWPAGRGDLSFDYWSPIIANTTTSGVGGATATWADNCVLLTRYVATHFRRYEADRGALNVLIFDRDMWRQYANKLDSKERINTSTQLGLRALGFEQETIQQDGVDITWEYGIPAAVGYALNSKKMKLKSMQDKLFGTDGPTYHELNRYWYVIIDFLGQLQFTTPRFFAKFLAIA